LVEVDLPLGRRRGLAGKVGDQAAGHVGGKQGLACGHYADRLQQLIERPAL
jgi:hypothetical protein